MAVDIDHPNTNDTVELVDTDKYQCTGNASGFVNANGVRAFLIHGTNPAYTREAATTYANSFWTAVFSNITPGEVYSLLVIANAPGEGIDTENNITFNAAAPGPAPRPRQRGARP